VETTTAIAIVLRPLFSFVFLAVVVAPIVWLLHKIIPNSRFKVILFRVRSGRYATRRDKVVMTLAVIAGYGLIVGFVAALM
jgi:hypothetical protein